MKAGSIGRLIVGVFACSTAAIFIKASRTHPVPLSAYRLLIAAAALTPAYLNARRAHGRAARRGIGVTALAGLLLALHFLSWIAGVRMTLAANASLIVNLVPVAMPGLAWLIDGDRITRGEGAGTALALSGAVLLGVSDVRSDRQTFAGDALCFASMLLFAGYLYCGRVNRGIPSIWLFVVPLYFVAGLVCLLPMPFVADPFSGLSAREVALILGLGILPTVVGHSALLHAMKSLRPQVVSLVNLGQFVFAGILAYLLLDERPAALFYPASLLLVVGSALAIRAGTPKRPVRTAGPPAGADTR